MAPFSLYERRDVKLRVTFAPEPVRLNMQLHIFMIYANMYDIKNLVLNHRMFNSANGQYSLPW